MANYDKDGDATMETQSLTEKELQQQLATTIGQKVSIAVQNSTDIGAATSIFAGISRVIEDPQSAPPQDSTPQLPPQPGQIPFKHQLPVDDEGLDKPHQLARAERVGSEEEARAREQTSKKLEGALREIRRLNSIIIKRGMPSVEFPDAEFHAEFCGIRDSIFGLVRAHFEAPNVDLRHDKKAPSNVRERQENWLGHWKRDSPELRIYRVQGAMFDIIDSIFFKKPFFAAENKDLEEQLKYFEESLERSPEISKLDVVEWRRRTVSAAKALNMPSGTAERAAREILETLEPARTLVATKQAKTQQLSQDLQAVCDKAFRLSLILRESKATFKVVVPAANVDIYADSAEMELIAMEDGRPPPHRQRVLFTAFGGLQKTALSPDEGEDIVMLEKAHVVGYEVQVSKSSDHSR